MTDWAISHPKARKPHCCEMCRRRIDPGEIYKRGAGFDGGDAWSWKECAHCEKVLRTYDVSWDGEYNEDSFAEWVDGGARDIEEARAMAGYRKQWRTAQGNLWPMPTTEPKEQANGKS